MIEMANEVNLMSLFRNSHVPGSLRHGMEAGKYIQAYTTRPDAVEPLILDHSRMQAVADAVFDSNDSTRSPATDLNQRLKYEGTAFDLDHLALDRKTVLDYTHNASDAEQSGRSVKEMVVSFDTKWLQEQGILDPDVDVENVQPGDLFGHVDELNLRTAAQVAFRDLIDHTDLHDPQFVASVQGDTPQVHIHAELFDGDPSVEDDRGLLTQGAQDDFKQTMKSQIESRREMPHHYNPLSALYHAVEINRADQVIKRQLLTHDLRNLNAVPEESPEDRHNADVNYGSQLRRYDWRAEQRYLKALGGNSQGRKLNNQRLLTMIQQDVSQAPREQVQYVRVDAQYWQSQYHQLRQQNAYRMAGEMRNMMNDYLIAQGQGLVAPEAQAMRQFYQVEGQANRMIVDKYRYDNPAQTYRVYHQHAHELAQSFQRQVDLYQQTLSQLPTGQVDKSLVATILQDQAIRARLLAESQNQYNRDHPLLGPMGYGPKRVEATSTYQHLQQLRDNSKQILSPLDLDLVAKATSHSPRRQQQIKDELSQNQHVKTNQLSVGQQQVYLRYLRQVMLYEDDLWTKGGLRGSDAALGNFGYPKEPQDPQEWLTNEYQQRVELMDGGQVLQNPHSQLDEAAQPRLQMTARLLQARLNVAGSARDYLANTGQDTAPLDLPVRLLENQSQAVQRELAGIQRPAIQEAQANRSQPAANASQIMELRRITEPAGERLVDKHLQAVQNEELGR